MKFMHEWSRFALLAAIAMAVTGCSDTPPFDQTRFPLPEIAQERVLALEEGLNKARRRAIEALEVEHQASVGTGRLDDAQAIKREITRLEHEIFLESFLRGSSNADNEQQVVSLEDFPVVDDTEETPLILPENAQKIRVQLAETENKIRLVVVKALAVELEAFMETARSVDKKAAWLQHGYAKAIMEEISIINGEMIEAHHEGGELPLGVNEMETSAKMKIFREEIRRIQTPWHDHPLRRFLTALSSGSEERHAPR